MVQKNQLNLICKLGSPLRSLKFRLCAHFTTAVWNGSKWQSVSQQSPSLWFRYAQGCLFIGTAHSSGMDNWTSCFHVPLKPKASYRGQKLWKAMRMNEPKLKLYVNDVAVEKVHGSNLLGIIVGSHYCGLNTMENELIKWAKSWLLGMNSKYFLWIEILIKVTFIQPVFQFSSWLESHGGGKKKLSKVREIKSCITLHSCNQCCFACRIDWTNCLSMPNVDAGTFLQLDACEEM